jgi:predicted ATPase
VCHENALYNNVFIPPATERIKMYQKLEILGLRGFSTKQVFHFAQPDGSHAGSGLTILIGPNNGGKSTILEALKVLSRANDTTSFTEGKRNKAAGDRIELCISSVQGDGVLKTVLSGGSESVWAAQNKGGEIFALPSRRHFNPYFGKGDTLREHYIRNILSTQERSAVSNFSGRLFRILQNQDAFNEILGRVLSPVPKWTIDLSDQGQHYLKFQTGNQFHNSDGLGEGIVSLFFIVDALYDSTPGSLISLDEPELSLHPMFQRRLARLLSDFSKDRQIVYATHSPYFVNFEDVANGGACVVRVTSGEDGSKVHELQKTTKAKISAFLADRNNPHVLGLDAREAFFLEDGVVLVEGQEDVVLYPSVLKQLGVGGAEKMELVASLFKDLGFSKIVGLLDGNRSETAESLRRKFPEYEFYSIPADDIRTKEAVKEKSSVNGLLDKNGDLKEEYKAELSAMFDGINQYMTGDEGVVRGVRED